MSDMPVLTSVVLQSDHDGEGLTGLVHSLDAQTAPLDEFEVLVPIDGVSPQTRARLEELAVRRPNVSVVPGTAADAAAAGQGTWLLVIPAALPRAGALLQAEALERLTRFAQEHDCDAVVARLDVEGGSLVLDLATGDVPRVHGISATAVTPGLALLRRDLAVDEGVPMTPAELAAVLASTEKVGVAGAYESLTIPAARSAAHGPTVHSASAHWVDGVVAIEVAGTTDASGPVLLSARHRRTRLEYWLDGEGKAADGEFRATARLDVRTAALGEPLPAGRWTVSVGVHGGEGWSARTPVPATGLPAALVDEVVVAVDPKATDLVLDVGATSVPAIPTIPPEAVTITESVRGTLLEAVLPAVHAAGSARIAGSIQLGGFVLPGYLVGRDGAAVLECYLSGLSGTMTISTRFGRVLAPCGLDVTIDAVGGMSVSATPPKVTKAVTAAGGAAEPGEIGTLQRIRRAVPAPLEPAVRKARANPTAKRLYRRLSGLR